MTQRTILFRGKRIDNGEWVYGLATYNHKCDGIDKIEMPQASGSLCVLVNPATVGQFTGLTDKNGTQIFDGDILHCIEHDGSTSKRVVYNNGDYFSFDFSTQALSSHVHIGWEFEVIGNIHTK